MKKTARGFTLIELMVVIAIIGLLISLTSPTLTQARQAGLRAKCMGNLRTIGAGIYLHIVDNNDEFPLGNLPRPQGGLTGNNWYSNLTPYMDSSARENKDVYTYSEDNILPDLGEAWTPGRAATYNAVWQSLMCPAQRGPVYAISQGIRSTYGYVTEFVNEGQRDTGKGVYIVYRNSQGRVSPRLLTQLTRPSITAAVMDCSHHYVHPRWYNLAWQRGALETMFPNRHNGYSTLFADGHVRLLPEEEVASPQSDIWRAF